MMMNKYFLFAVCGLALGLTACSGAKEQLGLERTPPDEFKVVKRAPLEMPPGYNLRPPKPGAPRPQEQEAVVQAKQTVFGEEAVQQSASQTGGESLLLQQAGATNPDPAIRQKVDAETLEQRDRNKPVAQKLFGIGGDRDSISANVVDAKGEAQRIKENAEAGKPVTEGETPAIEE